MPYLFGLLISFLIDFFGKKFVSVALRIAMALSFIAILTAAIYAYISAAGVLIYGIGMTVPTVASGVWAWVMPDNTNICFTAIGGVYLLRFFTRIYLNMLNSKYLAVINGP